MWISRRELARLYKQISFWRKRCESVEAELARERERLEAKLVKEREAFEAELSKERERNREREERLVDRVLTSRGSYPVTNPPKPDRDKSSSAAPALTAIEEAELDMYEASAVENGFGKEIGRKMWEKKKRGEALDWDEFSHLDEITT